jgi:rhodanese-related sulfurtransferase
MALSMRTMTTNQKLGLLLVVLGLLAAFAGSPYAGGKVSLDTAELARIVEKEADHVSPEEMADWIVQGRSDFRLIDLRTEKEYAEYHIPGAENIALTALADAGMQRTEKIVLYSEGGIHSAQAWMLLKARGYRGVYMLRGGLEEWREKVLFPRLPENPTPAQRVEFAKMSEVAKHFGGAPQDGGSPDQAAVTAPMPKLAMPQAPAGGAPAAAPKKKKKEGC